MKMSTVLKPTMLFAAGAIVSTAAGAAPTIEEVDYSPSSNNMGTAIFIGGSATPQYRFKDTSGNGAISNTYNLNAQGDSQVTAIARDSAFYPTAGDPTLSNSAITGQYTFKNGERVSTGVADGDQYFGLRFKINDDQYTGWAKANDVGDNISQIGYKLVGGGAGVPEPSSWALMIAGFGGVGLAMRRRRRQVAVAAVA